MKKVKFSKTQSENIQWLCRFLKENNAYYRYFQHMENWCDLKKTDIVRWKHRHILNYIYEAHLVGNINDEKYFMILHCLWLIFIYEHGLYGKSYTCGKKQLIDYINSALIYVDYYDIKNDEIKNKLTSILAKKKEL